ncbi:MAG: aspartyl-tRNA(Asn)/glutamyl-tRNA(Gln) amidotransferase subunit A [Chloroflexi bacterium]|jgi:aspartyl-tRNA(Asn)/glutamyl-tRNA(Gln) amidotransferase subunit A|nr:MAG: aspartyl-tRNA(Asn)/glutamyl-tRNA(Gln) amidotransferase subunit A [Chloroflexota bacterium]
MTEHTDDLCFLTIREAASLLASRALSPVDLTKAFLERIPAVDAQLHAYRTVLGDEALETATAAERDIMAGSHKGPLHGIPVAHKEQYDVQGLPSPVRSHGGPAPTSPSDATAVAKLREAGTVLLGHLVMPIDPKIPAPRNPWNVGHITGGSSSGSAAAIAAGLCMGSLGEDTAGSIRKPASLCGTVGFKPTFGRISRHGLAPLSYSLDDCGPLARTVEDSALLLQAVVGYDPKDSSTSTEPVPDFAAALTGDIKELTVGVPRHYFELPELGADSETLSAFSQALRELEGLGANIKEVTIPSLEYATVANATIYFSEELVLAHQALESGVQPEGSRKLSLLIGSLARATDYIQSDRARGRLRRELRDVFQTIDVLALPSQPSPAPSFEDFDQLTTVMIQVAYNLLAPFNLAGLPAISVPAGFSGAGLPIGLQLVGKAFDEAAVLKVAHAYEQQAQWFRQRPPV